MKGSGSYCEEAQCLCKVQDHQVVEANHTAAAEEHNIAIKPHIQTAGKDTFYVLNSWSKSYVPILEYKD